MAAKMLLAIWQMAILMGFAPHTRMIGRVCVPPVHIRSQHGLRYERGEKSMKKNKKQFTHSINFRLNDEVLNSIINVS